MLYNINNRNLKVKNDISFYNIYEINMLYNIHMSIELLNMLYNKYNINKINAKNEIIKKAYNIYNI